MDKKYFKIFRAADVNSSKPRTYRKYAEGGAFEDVPADYIVIGEGVNGTGIKDKSKVGNNVIRLNIGILGDESAIYHRGTLNMTEEGLNALKADNSQPDGERSGVFGTLATKEKVESDVAGWIVKAETGKLYINCHLD